MNRELNRLIYLDHSATTPVDPGVIKTMNHVLEQAWGNPSSLYGKGREAKIVLENAREKIASLLHGTPENLFFTSGGTEADNLALFGVMRCARRENRGNHLVISPIEHSAINKAAHTLETEGFRVTRLPINETGIIDPEKLRVAIEDDTVLVSVMYVNNEIGTIQPIEELGAICRSREVLFHTDAVQSFGKLDLNVTELPVDLVSISSHKIYGPKGVGAIYLRPEVPIDPVTQGGGQEKNIRTGTENMPGIAGFGEAAAICAQEIGQENNRLENLRNRFLSWIREAVHGEVLVNGDLTRRLGANLNLAFPGIEGESLLLALDLDGIAVSTGSACSSGSTKPSHVLTAIGRDPETAHSSIRITLGRSTTEEDLQYVTDRLAYHVNRLREFAF